jgi:hypothetical protein
MRNKRRTRRASPLVDQLHERCLLSAYGQPAIAGYTPAELASAFGLNAITFTSPSGGNVQGNGKGETIALIEEYHDPKLRSDLNTFDRTFHLPAASLTVIDQAGSQTDNGWALEESMDVEWVHAIAPGARILVVEAAPSNFQTSELQNQLYAENTARNMPGVVAISMSWGFMEMSNESSYDSYFTTPPGHAGITFIASSGDYGFSWYPAASPNVLSVGGSSLSVSTSGGYQSETAWFWSGGGYSPYEPEPAYQQAVQTTGQRSTPDVAFDGDTSTGVAVYETSAHSRKGSWQVSGGTSLGAPVWAGLIAIVDQGRALAGRGSLDGPTQTLPALYALPARDFHAVSPFEWFLGSGGPSGLLRDLFGPWSTGATANIATGLGSPNGPSLITDLVASTTAANPLARSAGAESATASSPTGLTRPAAPTSERSIHHRTNQHGHKSSRSTVYTWSVGGHRLVASSARTER